MKENFYEIVIIVINVIMASYIWTTGREDLAYAELIIVMASMMALIVEEKDDVNVVSYHELVELTKKGR